MKTVKFKLIYIISFLCIFLISCNNKTTLDYEKKDNSDSNVSSLEYISYDIYQQGVHGEKTDEFSMLMNELPLDVMLKEEQSTIDLSNMQTAQKFYSSYIAKWETELSYSISCLKNYLSEEDVDKLNHSQLQWKTWCETTNDLDESIIKNSEVILGTQQYIISKLIVRMEQYRDRVIHIKYMTYLIESYGTKAVDSNIQTWNTFCYQKAEE